jgi:hypothetical protein
MDFADDLLMDLLRFEFMAVKPRPNGAALPRRIEPGMQR